LKCPARRRTPHARGACSPSYGQFRGMGRIRPK
jgi:hypothetical protein